MSREIDLRQELGDVLTPQRESSLREAAREFSRELPGDQQVRIEAFDPATGNPSVIVSEDAPRGEGDFVRRALEHVRGVEGLLGFAAEQPAEFVPDPGVPETSAGAHAVNLQQLHRGIPIYDAARTVRFAPDGQVTEVVGRTVTVDEELSAIPTLSAAEAVRRAAEHVARPAPDEEERRDPFGEPLPSPQLDLSGFEPKVSAAFPERPDSPTVFEPGPFGEPIKASLIWFPLERLRLAWEVLLTFPDFEGQYRTIVDAHDGEVLFSKQLVATILGRGNVYRVDGAGTRQMTAFPLPLADYGLPEPDDLPPGFPDHWLDSGSASGNSVHAHLGDSGPTIQGQAVGGEVVFNPGSATGDEQKVLNIFYLNCFMHDYFYLLGFREPDGNFQRQNLGRGGAGNDRVDARSYPAAVWGTASMATPADGSSPLMKMGLVTSTNKHTAFDSTVVFHEFMHGVTNRLVGGRVNTRALDAPQSGGMGEGWGDYIACTITGRTVVGSWVLNRAGGMRGFRYDSNFPDSFEDLGKGRYTGVHNVGEIWCATLMEMNRGIGDTLGVQLVVDALKLSPANPSFLDMRDAILAALDAQRAAARLDESEHRSAQAGIWAAFAKFGMGPGATSNGAFLDSIVADFSVPSEPTSSVVEREVSPNATIPDNSAVGVTSPIEVDQGGAVERAAVSVDIAHPYAGDLIVELRPPHAAPVVLQRRIGGSSDDVVREFESDQSPALAAVEGSEARGTWALHVSDRASRDVGRLRRWGLRLELADGGPGAHGRSRPALQIPDDDPQGVTDSITLAQAGSVGALRVGLDVTHTYVGDLRVNLTAPSGQQATLHDREGAGSDNLIGTLSSDSDAALQGLVGEQIAGEWRLSVVDLDGQDVGKLNEWWIEITRA
jgi:extracellular elastinolytic metalloproteinase